MTTENHSFDWALGKLRVGARVSRRAEGWHRRWVVLENVEIRCISDRASSAANSCWYASSDDLLAEDWILLT